MQLSQKAVEHSGARVVRNAKVKSISYNAAMHYVFSYDVTDNGDGECEAPLLECNDGGGTKSERDTFQAVIIATPLEDAGIDLSGFGLDIPERTFQTTHLTLVKGLVNSQAFGLADGHLVVLSAC